ncbi:MAG: SpoIIE family protein phosphatase [Verrucomicrobia bacterium]|nr:SpoIIE family protein phosphatase [Verrucomicrobiota bacterium]
MDFKGRILIVDDEFISRRALGHALGRVGYTVTTVASGKEALVRLREEAYDLLVLDFEMPDLNGIEVCSAIRSDPRTAALPIIVLTGHSGEAEEIGCLQAGANDFVTKPVSAPALAVRIRTQVRLRALASELQTRNDRLEHWQRQYEADLNAARAVQQAIIPARFPGVPGWSVQAFYRPLIQVGGDVWNWRRLGPERWLIWMADATGHGVAAALYTSLIAVLFGHVSENATSPAEVLSRVSEEFFSVFRGKGFFTAACAIISAAGQVLYAGAAHPPAVLLRDQGHPELLPSQATLIGLSSSLRAEDSSFEVRAGEGLFLYTDGFYSKAGEEDDRWTHLDLIAALPAPRAAGTDFFERLISRLRGRSSGEAGFTDDVTGVLLTRPLGGATRPGDRG